MKILIKKQYENGIISMFGPKTVFTGLLIDFNFLETTIRSMECSIMSNCYRISKERQVRSGRDLDLSMSPDVIGRMIRCAPCDFP